MKYVLVYLTIAACLVLSCQENATNTGNHSQQTAVDYNYLDAEIAGIQSSVQLRKYWEEIGRLDQTFRREETSIVQQHGHDSPAHKEIWEKINATDAENLAKVERLLAKYGYPKKDSLGRKALNALFMVVHHAPDYEARQRNFPHLYKAYQHGDLKEGPFSMFLNRMYETKMGKRFEVGAVFKEEDRINDIIQALNLVTE